VTTADVMRVAQRVFRPERLTAVAVGPVSPKLARDVRRTLQGLANTKG
jgi:predicted Zn-dependent peptidase